jgi:hypothetical protein
MIKKLKKQIEELESKKLEIIKKGRVHLDCCDYSRIESAITTTERHLKWAEELKEKLKKLVNQGKTDSIYCERDRILENIDKQFEGGEK